MTLGCTEDGVGDTSDVSRCPHAVVALRKVNSVVSLGLRGSCYRLIDSSDWECDSAGDNAIFQAPHDLSASVCHGPNELSSSDP